MAAAHTDLNSGLDGSGSQTKEVTANGYPIRAEVDDALYSFQRSEDEETMPLDDLDCVSGLLAVLDAPFVAQIGAVADSFVEGESKEHPNREQLRKKGQKGVTNTNECCL